MESQTTSTETKQITIDVPAERLAEFYAFFGRFLAGGPGRGRRGAPRPPGHGHHGHHCGAARGPRPTRPRPRRPASAAPAGTTDL